MVYRHTPFSAPFLKLAHDSEEAKGKEENTDMSLPLPEKWQVYVHVVYEVHVFLTLSLLVAGSLRP